MAKHTALPEEITQKTIDAEADAKNWHRMNGTVLPEWGRFRKPSVMSAPVTETQDAA